MDCSLPGSSVHGDSPGKNTGVGNLSSLQGIFPTQGSNQVSLIAGRFFTAEPPGKPKNIGVGGLSFPQGIFPTQESNRGLLHCRCILYQLSHKGSPVALSLFIYILAAQCNLQDLSSLTRDQTWPTASTEYLTTCPPGNSLLAGLKSVNTSETLEQCWIHSNSNCE